MEPLLPNIQDESNTIEDALYSSVLPDHNSNEKHGTQHGEKVDKFRCYKRRWYVLALFSVAAASQTILWNTWGPIADTAKDVLNWTDTDIALLTTWGGVVFAVTVIPFSSLMDQLGLRKLFLMSQTMSLLGVGVRCLPVGVHNLKYTANAGQFLIALGGPVLMSGPPLLSSIWFPANQRTTATAISSSAPALGVAVSFLLGPAIVKEIKVQNFTNLNETTSDIHFALMQDSNSTVKSHHIEEIYWLLRIDLAWIAIQFILAWIYFPAKPPTPPSISADRQRENFWDGARHLVRSQYFWIPGLAYSVSLGVFNTWITQVDTMFKHTVEVGQETVGWIGFYTNIAGTLGGLVAGRCVDWLGGRMKWVLLTLTATATICFVWFASQLYRIYCLVCDTRDCIYFNLLGFAPHQPDHYHLSSDDPFWGETQNNDTFTGMSILYSLFVSCITYGLLINSAMPIYLELTVEGVYPVAEGIATGAINWLYNLTGLIFLVVMMIPDIGVLWMNWAVLGAIAFTIPLLLFYKEENKRLLLDTNNETTQRNTIK